MHRVLTIQDLSCVGRCSLTVALPVLSAMGLECSVLPTAVLSTHTGFRNPQCISLTEQLLPFVEHWQANHIQFHAVSIGYLADPAQAQAVSGILDRLDAPLVVVDPVLGDDGRLYSRITSEHLQAMGQLCRRANVILPNLTEAAALTGLPYRLSAEPVYLAELTGGLLELGAGAAVITGVCWRDNAIGFYGQARGEAPFFYQGAYIPRQFHGTGDLFAAVFTGSLLGGASLTDAAAKAAEFVRACVENTKEVTPCGVEFEPQLYRLWEK